MTQELHHRECTSASGTRIPALDGLRGFAILLILLYHVFSLPCGWTGVDLFFVLSGYLITGILLDTKGRRDYFKAFYLRRILRIFPLYFLLVTLIFIVAPLLSGKSDVFSLRIVPYFVFLENWTMPVHWTGYVSMEAYANPLWSIAIEEQFYALWPVVVFFLRRKALIFLMFAIIIGGLLLSIVYYLQNYHWGNAYMSTLVRMSAICIGGLIAVAQRYEGKLSWLSSLTKSIFWATFVLLLFVGLWLLPIYPVDWFFGTLGYVLYPLFWGATLVAVLWNQHAKWVGKLLTNKMLVYLGHRSYAVYLIHFPLLVIWRTKYLPKFNLGAYMENWIDLAGCLCCVGLTILLAELTWRWIEQPALRLQRRTDVPS